MVTATRSFALPGPDGARAVDLMANAVRQGTDTLHDVMQSAVARHVAAGRKKLPGSLFTTAELRKLADSFAASTASGNLLGRSKIFAQAEHARKHRFSDYDGEIVDHFARFSGPVPSGAPKGVLRYFLDLIPKLGIDPERWGARMQRQAFTVAKLTEQSLVAKVQDSLAKHLAGIPTFDDAGRGSTPLRGAELVQQVLDDAGVTPTNNQYAEMCYRTNVMDAYHTGLDNQLATPEMQATFPAWSYIGIRDGREGDDHRPKFGLHYPGDASFDEVRGERRWNCRCSKQVLTRGRWAKMMAGGAVLQTRW